MLGKQSAYAQKCVDSGFIGADFGIQEDLSNNLPEEWREFNREFIPIFLKNRPDKTKVAAGLACGALHTVSKGILKGDIVLSPDGAGRYFVGEVTGNYMYEPNGILPHRRPIQWFDQMINRADMSQALKNSTGSAGTVANITGYREEIEKLIDGDPAPELLASDETVEDPIAFAMEKHLEEFLVYNWAQSELAAEYDIYQEDGEPVGQQYPTDTGPIDILAISKDQQTLLVVELKKGRASDVVVGQISRYMGYVQEELAEEGQCVKGVIIALEDDQRIRRSLAIMPNIDFYRYQIDFRLLKP
jgi:restriction system protein